MFINSEMDPCTLTWPFHISPNPLFQTPLFGVHFQSPLSESAFGVRFWTPTPPTLRVLHGSELLLIHPGWLFLSPWYDVHGWHQVHWTNYWCAGVHGCWSSFLESPHWHEMYTPRYFKTIILWPVPWCIIFQWLSEQIFESGWKWAKLDRANRAQTPTVRRRTWNWMYLDRANRAILLVSSRYTWYMKHKKEWSTPQTPTVRRRT